MRVIVGREDHAFKVELCPTALKNALSPPFPSLHRLALLLRARHLVSSQALNPLLCGRLDERIDIKSCLMSASSASSSACTASWAIRTSYI